MTEYYKKNPDGTFTLMSSYNGGEAYYRTGNKVDEYLPTKYYRNGVTDYYTQNYDNVTYTQFDLFDANGNYKSGLFNGGRYYVTGTKPTY